MALQCNRTYHTGGFTPVNFCPLALKDALSSAWAELGFTGSSSRARYPVSPSKTSHVLAFICRKIRSLLRVVLTLLWVP